MDSSIFFSLEQQGDVLVVCLLRSVGSFAEDEARDEWNELAQRALEPEIKHVLLDFGALSYFGSTMLEWMVTLWKKLRAKDSTMVLCNLSEVGTEILHTAKFDTLWPVYDTRQSALQKLNEP